jgi:hypothetical protein
MSNPMTLEESVRIMITAEVARWPGHIRFGTHTSATDVLEIPISALQALVARILTLARENSERRERKAMRFGRNYRSGRSLHDQEWEDEMYAAYQQSRQTGDKGEEQ